MADTPITVTDITPSVEALVGHADGEVLETGEVVVYDFDENGQYIGWHKGVQA